MGHRHVGDQQNARKEALAWLAIQERWEDRLAELRRPDGGRRPRRRGPQPIRPARRAS
jgi:hypothetical protein